MELWLSAFDAPPNERFATGDFDGEKPTKVRFSMRFDGNQPISVSTRTVDSGRLTGARES